MLQGTGATFEYPFVKIQVANFAKRWYEKTKPKAQQNSSKTAYLQWLSPVVFSPLKEEKSLCELLLPLRTKAGKKVMFPHFVQKKQTVANPPQPGKENQTDSNSSKSVRAPAPASAPASAVPASASARGATASASASGSAPGPALAPPSSHSFVGTSASAPASGPASASKTTSATSTAAADGASVSTSARAPAPAPASASSAPTKHVTAQGKKGAKKPGKPSQNTAREELEETRDWLQSARETLEESDDENSSTEEQKAKSNAQELSKLSGFDLDTLFTVPEFRSKLLDLISTETKSMSPMLSLHRES